MVPRLCPYLGLSRFDTDSQPKFCTHFKEKLSMKSNISAPDMFKTLKDTRGGKHFYSVENSFSGFRKLKSI